MQQNMWCLGPDEQVLQALVRALVVRRRGRWEQRRPGVTVVSVRVRIQTVNLIQDCGAFSQVPAHKVKCMNGESTQVHTGKHRLQPIVSLLAPRCQPKILNTSTFGSAMMHSKMKS
uniref:Uncharacterized protein n=1 Tax=Knipowitschia caucasica TaxID=637954 RepID=A0AAV2M8Z5_KNICA